MAISSILNSVSALLREVLLEIWLVKAVSFTFSRRLDGTQAISDKGLSSYEPSAVSKTEVSNKQPMSADSGWIFVLEVTFFGMLK